MRHNWIGQRHDGKESRNKCAHCFSFPVFTYQFIIHIKICAWKSSRQHQATEERKREKQAVNTVHKKWYTPTLQRLLGYIELYSVSCNITQLAWREQHFWKVVCSGSRGGTVGLWKLFVGFHISSVKLNIFCIMNALVSTCA